jgi:hypothetical protein
MKNHPTLPVNALHNAWCGVRKLQTFFSQFASSGSGGCEQGQRRIFTINEQQNNDLSHPKIKQTIRDRGKTLGSGYHFVPAAARSEIDFDKRKFVQF